MPSAKLHGMKDCYKIKLRNVGYHLVYQVIDERIVVKIIAVGKRDRNFVYTKAKSRL
ncbi:type II toxin-antitoxin system RelE family toxin [Aggregatibacter actinomycetemcomitans]|uniref:type II toxin-antitoxin system RelE family toxin n=1 Tax=Aggregatibacter actinomycetemcomitans TaxID=714 RepID=UPI000316B84F